MNSKMKRSSIYSGNAILYKTCTKDANGWVFNLIGDCIVNVNTIEGKNLTPEQAKVFASLIKAGCYGVKGMMCKHVSPEIALLIGTKFSELDESAKRLAIDDYDTFYLVNSPLIKDTERLSLALDAMKEGVFVLDEFDDIERVNTDTLKEIVCQARKGENICLRIRKDLKMYPSLHIEKRNLDRGEGYEILRYEY